MQTKRIILLVSFFSLFLGFVQPKDKTIELGGDLGWKTLSYSKGIVKGSGRLGEEALVLSSHLENSPKASENIDLYLSFDNYPFDDESNNYEIIESKLIISNEKQAYRGKGAAICNTKGEGLKLYGSPGSIFGSSGELDSFIIEFWINPTITENGSILFQWRSSRINKNSSFFQYIIASIMKNHIEWRFSNIWYNSKGEPINVVLPGRENLIPGQWSFHQLSWDSSYGLLEYRINGLLENMSFVTSTEREEGEVYPIILGTAAPIEIAPRYSGVIDEFKILKDSLEECSLESMNTILQKFSSFGGRFETQALDTGYFNSKLLSVSAVQDVPEGTDIIYFVRSGDNFYEWTETYPKWIPISLNQNIENQIGKYFQVSGQLYPDGRGELSPSLTKLFINYVEDSPPLPPIKIFAESENEAVNISWINSVDIDVEGYLIYFGERPGEYLLPNSPIDVGNTNSYKLSNLQNGKMYFFSIAAYDIAGPNKPGPLSKEVSQRPKPKP